MGSLSNKLAMNHLERSDADLASEIEEDMKESEAEEEVKADPRDQETYSFPFEYVDRKGRKFSAMFTNQILSIGEKMSVAALASKFSAGQPYDSVEPLQQVINHGVAHMTVSLKKRANQKPKKWADNLRILKDDDLILALFGEVSAHEGVFHGRIEASEGSEGQAGDTESNSGEVVRPEV